MKMKFKYIIMLLVVGVVALSCERPEIGFLSDNIQTPEDVIRPNKGVFFVSSRPIVDGSTFPLSWEILEVRDGNGNITTELFETYEISTWKVAYNPATDTTLAQLEEKLEISEQPSMILNDVSGQMAFTPASRYLANDDYELDMRVTNVKGTRDFINYAQISFGPFNPFETASTHRFAVQGARADAPTSWVFLNDLQIAPQSVGAMQLEDGTHPNLSITKISDDTAPGITVHLRVTDQNGNYISRKHGELAFWPSGATFLSSYHDNSIETVETDEGSTFYMPATPFPAWGTYGGVNQYLMYYIVPGSAIEVDWDKFDADHAEFPFHRGYLRFAFKLNEPGTWEIRYKIDGVNRVR